MCSPSLQDEDDTEKRAGLGTPVKKNGCVGGLFLMEKACLQGLGNQVNFPKQMGRRPPAAERQKGGHYDIARTHGKS